MNRDVDDPSAASPTSAPSRRRTTRGGKGGAEPRRVIRHREQRVVTLSDQGWTQEAIADELGISQAAVSKILRRVDDRALRTLSTQVAYFKMRRARHLEYLSRESRRGWEQSKQERVQRRQTKVSRADGTPVVTQHVVSDEHPDPRMLDQARKAEEALADLYGLSVPTPAPTPGSTDPRHREVLPPLVQLSDDLLERAHAELTQPRDPQDDPQ